MSQQIGFAAEHQAREYLTQQGLQFVARNYRCRWGEIDLIMRDNTYLVFIEVRSRVSAEYGGALESISRVKQKKILKTAAHYLMVHKACQQLSSRFDVVALQGNQSSINWIRDAFNADVIGY